jgi:hypothetical protein
MNDMTSKIFSGPVTFLKSAPKLEFLPDPIVPEIAFAGRSNVGKSSLINALVNRKAMARASNTPGRTQELNFFDVGDTAAVPPRRHAGLWLCQGTAERWCRPGAGWCAIICAGGKCSSASLSDRQPPRHQGSRPRDHEDARRPQQSATASC